MKTSSRLLVATSVALLAGAAFTSHSQVVIGGWQSSTAEGWIDWGNTLSITDPANSGKYSFVPGAVSGYGQSLQVNQAGFNQNLSLKLEFQPGGNAAFLTNHLLSFTFSTPSAAASGSTAGYSQLYAMAINASGYGFNNVSWSNPNWSSSGDTANNQSGMPNYYYYSGAPARSQTVTLDYTSLLGSITATPSTGYIELIFTSNNGGGAPANWYMNNVVLSGGPVPEPASFALFGLGAAVFALRRVRKC